MPIIEPEVAKLQDLSRLYYQMQEDDHVEGLAGFVYSAPGADDDPSKEQKTNYASGYHGVKGIIAKSVGDKAADQIMQDVLGKSHKPKDRGWFSSWKSDNAISKQDLKKILDATYSKLAGKLVQRDVRTRKRMLLKLYGKFDPKNPNRSIRKFHERVSQVDVGQAPFTETMKDPELRQLIRAQAQTERTGESFEFLEECEHYDTLVQRTENLGRALDNDSLVHENGGFQDEDGHPIDVDDNGKASRSDGKVTNGTRRVDQYLQAFGKVRAKAGYIQDRYVKTSDYRDNLRNNNIGQVDDSYSANISSHIGSQILATDVKQASLQELKSLFGPDPVIVGSGAGARGEVFAMLKDVANHAADSLLATTNAFPKKDPKDGYAVDMTHLEQIHERMDDGDRLKMQGSAEPLLYIKPKKKKHCFSWLTKFFTKGKSDRAKRVAEGALAKKLGNPALANRLMSRVKDKRTLDKGDLSKIVSYGTLQHENTQKIDYIGRINGLDVLNSVTGQQLLGAWKRGSANNIPVLAEDFAKLYMPQAKDVAVGVSQIANDINDIMQSRSSEKLKDAQRRARIALRIGGKYLTPSAKSGLESFVKLKSPNFGNQQRTKLGQLTHELEYCAERTAHKVLVSLKNTPLYGNMIGEGGMRFALANMSSGQLDDATVSTLADPNANVTKAFRIYCQSQGRNESHRVELAGFREDLNDLRRDWPDPNALKQLKTKALELADIGVKFSADYKRENAVSNRKPAEILDRIKKGKSVRQEDVDELSLAIDEMLTTELSAFKSAVPQLRQQQHSDADMVNSSNDNQVPRDSNNDVQEVNAESST